VIFIFRLYNLGTYFPCHHVMKGSSDTAEIKDNNSLCGRVKGGVVDVLYFEGRGSRFLRNVGNYLPICTTSRPRSP